MVLLENFGPAFAKPLRRRQGRTSYGQTHTTKIQIDRLLTAKNGCPTYNARHSKVPEREPSRKGLGQMKTNFFTPSQTFSFFSKRLIIAHPIPFSNPGSLHLPPYQGCYWKSPSLDWTNLLSKSSPEIA